MLEYLKTLEIKISEIHNLSNDTRSMQIKGEKQLADLTSEKDIDRSHRIGKLSPRKKRPIILKFVRYNYRHKTYLNKKRLKDSGISITESLTGYKIGQLNKAQNEHGF